MCKPWKNELVCEWARHSKCTCTHLVLTMARLQESSQSYLGRLQLELLQHRGFAARLLVEHSKFQLFMPPLLPYVNITHSRHTSIWKRNYRAFNLAHNIFSIHSQITKPFWHIKDSKDKRGDLLRERKEYWEENWWFFM